MGVLILLTLLSLCSAQNHHQLCEDKASSITCACTSTATQLDLEDDHDGFFQEARKITIINCGRVHLTPPSLVNAQQLENLYLINNGEVILDTEFPRSFSTLEIVNVTSLVKLDKPLFNRRQHMKLLKIKNTNINKISKHTFTDLRIERIEFSNSRFYNLTEYSLYIYDKQIQSAVKMPFHIHIKDCEFTDIPSNSISFIGAEEVEIENVKIAAMDEAAMVIRNTTHVHFVQNNIAKMQNNSLYFNLGSAKSFVFKENILPCHCKSVCDPETTAILQNIEFFTKTYQRNDFHLCSKVQNNYCFHNNTLSHVIYLQKQCDTTHYFYSKLKELNCTHSESDTKKCRNNANTKSASLGFTLLAVAFSIFALYVSFCYQYV